MSTGPNEVQLTPELIFGSSTLTHISWPSGNLSPHCGRDDPQQPWETYSKSWRWQDGSAMTSHRRFIPLSPKGFMLRLRCVRCWLPVSARARKPQPATSTLHSFSLWDTCKGKRKITLMTQCDPGWATSLGLSLPLLWERTMFVFKKTVRHTCQNDLEVLGAMPNARAACWSRSSVCLLLICPHTQCTSSLLLL